MTIPRFQSKFSSCAKDEPVNKKIVIIQFAKILFSTMINKFFVSDNDKYNNILIQDYHTKGRICNNLNAQYAILA